MQVPSLDLVFSIRNKSTNEIVRNQDVHFWILSMADRIQTIMLMIHGMLSCEGQS